MASKSNKILIYVSRNRLDFYYQNSDIARTLQFSAGVLQDLEVVDQRGLQNSIISFIKSNKLQTGRAIFVLSPSVVFEKSFKKGVTSMIDDDIRLYVNKVPFENTLWRTYELGNSYIVCVVNEEIVSLLQTIFEEQDFFVEGFVPLSQIDPQAASSHSFTPVQARSAFAHFNGLHNLAFARESKITAVEENIVPEETSEKRTEPNRRLYALVGVFVLLIAVLVFMVLTMTPK